MLIACFRHPKDFAAAIMLVCSSELVSTLVLCRWQKDTIRTGLSQFQSLSNEATGMHMGNTILSCYVGMCDISDVFGVAECLSGPQGPIWQLIHFNGVARLAHTLKKFLVSRLLPHDDAHRACTVQRLFGPHGIFGCSTPSGHNASPVSSSYNTSMVPTEPFRNK